MTTTSQNSSSVEAITFDKDRLINVAVLAFDNVEALDLNGPIDVITKANFFDKRFNLYTVSPTGDQVIAEEGIYKIAASYAFENAPQADILIIPGAFPAYLKTFIPENPAIINWINEQHQASTITMSVCTGALFLAAAGILKGLNATTHHFALDELRNDESICVVDDRRYVQDGKVITTAGITSGIDGSLFLVELVNGAEMADRVAHLLVYNRHDDLSFMKTLV